MVSRRRQKSLVYWAAFQNVLGLHQTPPSSAQPVPAMPACGSEASASSERYQSITQTTGSVNGDRPAQSSQVLEMSGDKQSSWKNVKLTKNRPVRASQAM